jgi:multicomponent K+:H+ antiporter subunit D
MTALGATLPILPIAGPLLAGALLLPLARRAPRLAAALGLATLAGNLACAALLLEATADGTVIPYLVGNWQAPFGIALAADGLAALMLLVTAITALGCQLAALDGPLRQGRDFPALLQFQVVGLNGAFLTADLFNLFVFFEVLLIASYALLLHRAERPTVRAGLHYVAVNLVGSVLFLVAVSLLYGTLGTLNIADLAGRIAAVPEADAALVAAAGALLLVVFGIKSAALPLGLWLPGTYPAAPAPVAALFAVMTKVGIYSIARLLGVAYGADTGPLAGFGTQLVLYAGLATLAASAVGVLAARTLRSLTAWLVVGSAGTLLAALGAATPAATAAALFYLPHSTFAAAALFLVAGIVAAGRGESKDRLEAGPAPAPLAWIGALFAVTAIAAAGLPPLSGFVAKLFVLDALEGTPGWGVSWTLLLLASLTAVVALSRAGSALFWKPVSGDPPAAATPAGGGAVAALALLAGSGVALVIAAAPLTEHLATVAGALGEPSRYVSAVLDAAGWVPP